MSSERPADRLAKVVLVGSSGSGKSAILKAVAEQYAHSSVRAGELGEGTIFRTEFYWPQPRPDGEQVRVRLFALSGQPIYRAVTELALAGADGIIFVASLLRDHKVRAREALQLLTHSALQSGLDLASMPAAVHYHHSILATRGALLEPDEMDQWLGIAPGSVPRFVSGAGGEDMRASVEWIVAELVRGVGGESKVA